MAPTLVREPFHRDGWVYEEKVDGWRMLAYKDGGYWPCERCGGSHVINDCAYTVAEAEAIDSRQRPNGEEEGNAAAMKPRLPCLGPYRDPETSAECLVSTVPPTTESVGEMLCGHARPQVDCVPCALAALGEKSARYPPNAAAASFGAPSAQNDRAKLTLSNAARVSLLSGRTIRPVRRQSKAGRAASLANLERCSAEAGTACAAKADP